MEKEPEKKHGIMDTPFSLHFLVKKAKIKTHLSK